MALPLAERRIISILFSSKPSAVCTVHHTSNTFCRNPALLSCPETELSALNFNHTAKEAITLPAWTKPGEF